MSMVFVAAAIAVVCAVLLVVASSVPPPEDRWRAFYLDGFKKTMSIGVVGMCLAILRILIFGRN